MLTEPLQARADCDAERMTRLIALTEERGARVVWLNTDHIVSIRLIVTRTGTRASVTAEIKLTGMPVERFSIDDDCAQDDLDQVWTALIASIDPTPARGTGVDELTHPGPRPTWPDETTPR